MSAQCALRRTLSRNKWTPLGALQRVTELWELTAIEVVNGIRGGEFLAVDVLTSALARAAAESDLNAFIAVDGDAALRAAAAVDQARAAGRALPPLAGLPIVIKDNIDLTGWPTTGATPALRQARPAETAPTAQALLTGGAIAIGKTNLHELALGFTTINDGAPGSPRNPYRRDHITGGSSGGTAAAIAGRIAPAGLGTDTGGSVRVPAALSGLVGLRPSVGNGTTDRRYAAEGVLPITFTLDTVGPLARTVADVALLDATITGAAHGPAAKLADVRLGIPRQFWAGLDARLEAAARSALDALTAAGVTVVDVDFPEAIAAREEWFPAVLPLEWRAAVQAYLEASAIADVTPDRIAAEAVNRNVRELLASAVAAQPDPDGPEVLTTHRPRLQRRYRQLADEHGLDALIFPTTVLPAESFDNLAGHPSQAREMQYGRNTVPGALAGVPGLSLFGGTTHDGLPIGLELDGPIGSDGRLLAIGLAVEEVLGRAPLPPIAQPPGHRAAS